MYAVILLWVPSPQDAVKLYVPEATRGSLIWFTPVVPALSVFQLETNGGTAGVTALEAGDGFEVPVELVAVVVNVYDVPFCNPTTSQEPEVPVTVQVKPPGDEVMVKDEGAGPWAAVTLTLALALPPLSTGAGGVSGGKA